MKNIESKIIEETFHQNLLPHRQWHPQRQNLEVEETLSQNPRIIEFHK